MPDGGEDPSLKDVFEKDESMEMTRVALERIRWLNDGFKLREAQDAALMEGALQMYATLGDCGSDLMTTDVSLTPGDVPVTLLEYVRFACLKCAKVFPLAEWDAHAHANHKLFLLNEALAKLAGCNHSVHAVAFSATNPRTSKCSGVLGHYLCVKCSLSPTCPVHDCDGELLPAQPMPRINVLLACAFVVTSAGVPVRLCSDAGIAAFIA